MLDIQTIRQNLYNKLIEKESIVKLINGKNKGETGIVVKLDNLRNYKYGRYNQKYYNYFQLFIKIKNKIITTSCDYIQII